MTVLVTVEARFERTPDGATWTQTVFARPFWDRYLAVFERVRVLARVREVPGVRGSWQRVDGGAVGVVPVPHYRGARQYLFKRSQVIRAVRQSACGGEAVIVRVPTVFASILLPRFRRERRPYGVEVVGDPYDVFAPGAVNHPLRPFLRSWTARQLRAHCRGAVVAGYVTREALQRRYPAPAHATTGHYSSIDLDHDAFVEQPRTACHTTRPRTLVAIGSLDQLYKGPDVLINAVRILARQSVDVRLVWVGDGSYRPMLEREARRHRIEDRIRFAGELLPGAPVRAELDRADLLVMPSRAEGLPRAMIEAMARGLPCVGSRVGGIPELLSSDEMVQPGDPAELARLIRDVLGDPARMATMSARSLATAADYRSDLLQARRTVLYKSLRAATAAWSDQAVVAAQVHGVV